MMGVLVQHPDVSHKEIMDETEEWEVVVVDRQSVRQKVKKVMRRYEWLVSGPIADVENIRNTFTTQYGVFLDVYDHS